MRPADNLKVSLRNAFRRRGRAALTITAVVIGAFTFTITSGLGAGVNSYIDSQVNAIGAADTVQITASAPMALLSERMEEYDPDLASAVPGTGGGILGEEDIETVRELLDGAEIFPAVQWNTQYFQTLEGERYRFIYNGYWPGKQVNLLAGEQLDDTSSVPELIVPSYAIEPLGFRDAADAVGGTVVVGVLDQARTMHEITARIVGVQERALIGGNLPFGNRAFDEQLQSFSLEGAPPDSAIWYPYALAVVGDVEAAVEELTEEGYSATTAAQSVGDYQTIVNGVLLVLNFLASIAIAAAMFGIVNTLLMSVQERTRNLGMSRALGMSRSSIFTTTTLEAALLGFLGSIVAVALALAVGSLAGPALLQATGLDLPGLELFRFEGAVIAAIVIGITVATAIAALLPAIRAARLEPMDALREEL